MTEAEREARRLDEPDEHEVAPTAARRAGVAVRDTLMGRDLFVDDRGRWTWEGDTRAGIPS